MNIWARSSAAVRRYLKICGLSLSRKRLSETSTPFKTLYIFDELTRLRTSNEETAKLVQQRIESWESVTADSAEMKSCADYRAFGILCREAVKGPGSVNQSMKWLQGLTAIVIDPHRGWP